MRMKSFGRLPGAVCFPILASLLAGCASQTVRTGDLVGVHFTCRMKDGEIAASTYTDVNESSLPKSGAFTKRNRGDAVDIEAGVEKAPLPGAKRRSFEEEIMDRLAGPVVGMKVGEEKSLVVTADRLSGLPREEQFLKIGRVWKQAKEMKMSRDRFRDLAGKEPALGATYAVYNAVPGKVVSVTGDEVVLRFAATADETRTPFGKGIIREKEDRFEIDIQAVKGTLLRTGGMIGRITDVDAEFITIDYGHPFGGEALNCEVKVESARPGENKAGTAEKNVSQDVNDATTKPAAPESAAAAEPGTVQKGDLVVLNYTAALTDGTIFATTSESAAKDPARKKVSWFREPARYAAEEIVAGREELLPGLGEAALGMKPGEKKELRLAPENAFGPVDPRKQEQLPCVRTFPRVIRMPADEYVKRFSSFPLVNKEVDLVPYFKARVTEVTERDVALEFLAKDGATFDESYGTVTVSVKDDQVTTTLKPRIGADFPTKDATGIIAATDGASFTVDTNSPLAGKPIIVDLEVVSLTKAAALQTKPIDWIEDHDKGLAEAQKEGKPLFLLLYADWCGWCKKTMTETLPDPRIMQLKDKFVWAKVNSDKETRYKQQYGQNGYPLMMVLNPDGTVRKRIDGFRDARGLKAELDGVM